MDNAPANSNDHAQKLTAEIKKAWPKLTEEEAGWSKSNPDKFYAATTKLGVSKEDAEKMVKKLDAECAAACSTTDGKSAETGSAPLPKAANA
jgi:hypothetical protein